jgi:hypothetical protein
MTRLIRSSTLCALLGLGLCLGTPQAKADINLATSPGGGGILSGGMPDNNGYTAGFYTDATVTGLTSFPAGLGTAPAPDAGGLPAGLTTTFAPVVVGPNGTFPVGTNWSANTTTSSWIGPNSVGAAGDNAVLASYLKPGFTADHSAPQGYFYYDKSFSLGSTSAPAAHLVGGLWATDNNGISIYLNGTLEGAVNPGTGFVSFSSFSVNPADFVVGTNHIDFVVFNENFDPAHFSPTGLRVEGSVVVPEPSTMAIAALGAFGFIGYGLRRKAKGV